VYATELSVGKIQLNVEEKLAGQEPVPLSLHRQHTVGSAKIFILVCGTIGIFVAIFLFLQVRAISLTTHNESLKPLMVVSTSTSDQELIWGVPEGRVYSRRLVFVSVRTIKRHHHHNVYETIKLVRVPSSGPSTRSASSSWQCLQW
jgi:hypothetical protein